MMTLVMKVRVLDHVDMEAFCTRLDAAMDEVVDDTMKGFGAEVVYTYVDIDDPLVDVSAWLRE